LSSLSKLKKRLRGVMNLYINTRLIDRYTANAIERMLEFLLIKKSIYTIICGGGK
jgi:hypothetical protein